MSRRAYSRCFFLILFYVETTTTHDCPSWWPWCSSNGTVNTITNWPMTTVSPMTTMQGSFCNCLLFAWGRSQREKIVAKLMEDAFVNITQERSAQTNQYFKLSESFDLVGYILSHANVLNLRNAFNHVRNGSFFTDDFFKDTFWYVKVSQSLQGTINYLYVYPLARELQQIAIKHGTSIGVFRAGETLTYDGICTDTDQNGDGTTDWKAHLFEQQCQINLSYLIKFSLNTGCLSSNTFGMRVAKRTETAFDEYMSLKDRRYVRSAVTVLSRTTGKTDFLVKLFYNSNGIIQDLRNYLNSMTSIQFYCDTYQKYEESSAFLLVNCTWYDNGTVSRGCIPVQGNTSSTTTSFTLPGSTPPAETTVGDGGNNGNITSQNGNTDESYSSDSITGSNSTQPSIMPSLIPQLSSLDLDPSTSVDLNPTESISSQSSSSSSIQYSSDSSSPPSLPSTLSLTTPQISTIFQDDNSPTSSTAQIPLSPSLATVSTTDSNLPIDSSAMSPTSSLESNPSSPVPSTSAQSVLQDNSLASVATSPSSLPQSKGTSALVPTSGISVGNTTPFDDDPFFKAVVPVFTKKYNDEFLLRLVGTMRPITSHDNFYWITIPVCISAIILAMLCLICLQVDWLAVCTEKTNSEKLAKK